MNVSEGGSAKGDGKPPLRSAAIGCNSFRRGPTGSPRAVGSDSVGLRQQFGVDPVLAERGLVSLERQTAKPHRNTSSPRRFGVGNL
jgi:hypothetical protein